MLPLVKPRARRLTRIQCAAVCVCAFSLVLVLANRFPRIQGNEETSWVASTPSHMTAKALAKDFYVFSPPASGAITLLHATPSPLETREAYPFVSIFLDNRLFTRPPPSA